PDVGLVLVDGRQLADRLVLGLVGEVLLVEPGPHVLQPRPLRLEPLPGRVGVHGGSLPGGTLAASGATASSRRRGSEARPCRTVSTPWSGRARERPWRGRGTSPPQG